MAAVKGYSAGQTNSSRPAALSCASDRAVVTCRARGIARSGSPLPPPPASRRKWYPWKMGGGRLGKFWRNHVKASSGHDLPQERQPRGTVCMLVHVRGGVGTRGVAAGAGCGRHLDTSAADLEHDDAQHWARSGRSRARAAPTPPCQRRCSQAGAESWAPPPREDCTRLSARSTKGVPKKTFPHLQLFPVHIQL